MEQETHENSLEVEKKSTQKQFEFPTVGCSEHCRSGPENTRRGTSSHNKISSHDTIKATTSAPSTVRSEKELKGASPAYEIARRCDVVRKNWHTRFIGNKTSGISSICRNKFRRRSHVFRPMGSSMHFFLCDDQSIAWHLAVQ